MEENINTWLGNMQRLVKQLKAVNLNSVPKDTQAEFTYTIHLLTADSQGWSLALESVSSVIKANLDYLKKSIGKYGTKGTDLAGMKLNPVTQALPAS